MTKMTMRNSQTTRKLEARRERTVQAVDAAAAPNEHDASRPTIATR